MIPIRDPKLHGRFRRAAALLGVSLAAGLAGCGDGAPAAPPATAERATPTPPVAKVARGKAAKLSPVLDEDTSHHLMRRNKQLRH